jgi:hypothetical protein
MHKLKIDQTTLDFSDSSKYRQRELPGQLLKVPLTLSPLEGFRGGQI